VGTCPPPPKKNIKILFGQLRFGYFSGKNHVKFGNFVNFSGKYNKNSRILLIFARNDHVKFGHFVNFSYIFFGQKCLAPLKLSELLRL